MTPEQIASAISDWFDRAGSAGLKLPGGWFGRPNDNQFRLAHATVADGIVVVSLDDGGLLTLCAPMRVEATPTMLRLSGSRYIQWRWIGFGSDDAMAEVFESENVEFHHAATGGLDRTSTA